MKGDMIMYDDNNNIEYESELISEEEVLEEKREKKPGKGKDFLKLTVYATVFGLIGGVSFQGFNYVSDRISNSNQSIEEAKDLVLEEDKSEDVSAVTTGAKEDTAVNGVSEVVKNTMPSIVSINSTYATTTDMFGRLYEDESTGSGSGIIIGQNKSEVLVATNNHVVDGATTVEVIFSDETSVTATVKGTDAGSDLAVVSIALDSLKEETKKAIRVATLGDSEKIEVGEMAIAIGNALGYGQSVTVGYISAKEREVALEDYNMTLLQTDAAINPGNSGGALLNSSGEVIGINSVKYASENVEGMGYAIPISKAIPIINELMNREDIPEKEQAYLGIKGQDVTEAYAERFNMPIGVYIGEVTKDSPAEKAGLVQGSIITGFNGKSISSFSELQEVLSYTKAGDTATFTVQVFDNGEYKEKNIDVTLGNK
jgi:serine protease Do